MYYSFIYSVTSVPSQRSGFLWYLRLSVGMRNQVINPGYIKIAYAGTDDQSSRIRDFPHQVWEIDRPMERLDFAVLNIFDGFAALQMLRR